MIKNLINWVKLKRLDYPKYRYEVRSRDIDGWWYDCDTLMSVECGQDQGLDFLG